MHHDEFNAMVFWTLALHHLLQQKPRILLNPPFHYMSFLIGNGGGGWEESRLV
jgi:hypothetical protein